MRLTCDFSQLTCDSASVPRMCRRRRRALRPLPHPLAAVLERRLVHPQCQHRLLLPHLPQRRHLRNRPRSARPRACQKATRSLLLPRRPCLHQLTRRERLTRRSASASRASPRAISRTTAHQYVRAQGERALRAQVRFSCPDTCYV